MLKREVDVSNDDEDADDGGDDEGRGQEWEGRMRKGLSVLIG